MSKALVLENGFVQDIPKQLIRYLDREKIEWEWYDMRTRFWPENREATFTFFSELPEGQELICNTTFDGYAQLELMIELLYKLRHKHFTFKIEHGCLCDGLLEFLNEKESSISPRELDKALEGDLTDEECDEVYEKLYQFKRDMNQKFFDVLQAHEVYWISRRFDTGIGLLKTLEDIKENTYE